jgi:hypothetical protein
LGQAQLLQPITFGSLVGLWGQARTLQNRPPSLHCKEHPYRSFLAVQVVVAQSVAVTIT